MIPYADTRSYPMAERMLFGEVLDAVDELEPEEQETLVEIVSRRIAERGRKRVLADVQEARREYENGGCPQTTVNELIKTILL
jgi:hypothetical protein